MDEDTRTDIRDLVKNGLLHEASGAYRLHDLTHEVLHLLSRMDPSNLALATNRQAIFLAKAETMRAYAEDVDDVYGGLYSLVRLWVTLWVIDGSGSAWKHMVQHMVQVREAATDTTYMTHAGTMLMIMVSMT